MSNIKYYEMYNKFKDLIYNGFIIEAHDYIHEIEEEFPNLDIVERAKLYSYTNDYTKAIELLTSYTIDQESAFLLANYYRENGDSKKCYEVCKLYLEICENPTMNELIRIRKLMDYSYLISDKKAFNLFNGMKINSGDIVKFRKGANINNGRYSQTGLVFAVNDDKVYYFPLCDYGYDRKNACIFKKRHHTLNSNYEVRPFLEEIPLSAVGEVFCNISGDEFFRIMKLTALNVLYQRNPSELNKQFMMEYRKSLKIKAGDLVNTFYDGKKKLYFMITDDECVTVDNSGLYYHIKNPELIKLNDLLYFDILDISDAVKTRLMWEYNELKGDSYGTK